MNNFNHAGNEVADTGHGRRRLRLVAFDHPSRTTPKPLGWVNEGARELLAYSVVDARMHVHTLGPTGVGKSTHEQHQVVAEACAGRGVALLEPQGDLALGVLDRLPDDCAYRLVIIDPDERTAPPAWNPLQVHSGGSPELVAENVVGVLRRLYSAFWGPRMEDTLRAACLTLAQRPGSSLADVLPLLINTEFRRRVLTQLRRVPMGLEGFWDDWNNHTPAQRLQACGPLLARLRAVFTRPFIRDLLGSPHSTFSLDDILDGGVLIARLPKGVLGEEGTRLIGSLLLAGLWQATTARAGRPADQRPDATIVIDECHNFLNLPIGVADALAESRGYRVSWVLAHQHLGQLTPELRAAVDANARNKLYFTLAPDDATKLAHHVAPYLDANDLSGRPAYQITCRIMNEGRAEPAFTVDAPSAEPPIPGRAEWLRARARAHTGLHRDHRGRTQAETAMAERPDADQLQDVPIAPAVEEPSPPYEWPDEPEPGVGPWVRPWVGPSTGRRVGRLEGPTQHPTRRGPKPLFRPGRDAS